MLKSLFELRGELKKSTKITIEIVGFIILLGIWSFITHLKLIPSSLLPTPWSVVASFKELHFNDALIQNTVYSIQLNFLGYCEAVLICVPFGFLIGLFPLFKGLFQRYIDALRYLPLTAITGLFIAWFGIDTNMKVQFLAFGIIVYLLPVVVQRIHEVEDVYINTVKTLGAKKWQIIKLLI